MLITTTNTVEGKKVKEYLGLVTGETIIGVNFVKDIFASVRDVFGGRSGTYEEELKRAREIATSEMESKAQALGADAVIGVDLDYETVGASGSMLMINVSGTAVRFE